MFSEKSYVKLFCITSLIVFVIISFSCNIFTEPDAEMNNATRSPKTNYKTAVLKNYTVDQVVFGDINITFNPEIKSSEIDHVYLFVDSVHVPGGSWPYWYDDYSFIFHTNNWPDGKHFISFYIYKKPDLSDSLGMNSYFSKNSFIYTTSLIFDNTPPTAPENVNVQIVNNNAQITWSATNIINFSSYIIKRDGNIIAEINSKNTTAYSDTTLPDFYKGSYEVGVSNGNETVYAPKYSCVKGELLGINASQGINNLNNQVIFVGSDNTLSAVSTQTHEIIRQSNDGNAGVWAKNASNDTIYCATNSFLFTYDVRTLNLVRTQNLIIPNTLTEPAGLEGMAIGPGNQIYFTIVSHNEYKSNYNLFSFNKDETSFSLKQSSPIINDISGDLSLSPDGSILVARAISSQQVKEYIFNNDSKKFSLKSEIIDNSYAYQDIYADWKNSEIFDTHYKISDEEIIEVRDIQTFKVFKTFETPKFLQMPIYINDFLVNSKNLYIAYFPNILCEVDKKSGQLLRRWKFSTEVLSLHGSENGRYLFARTEKNGIWIVDLGGAQ